MNMHEDDDGGTPRDLDGLRLRLFRRLANLKQGWKRCATRPCRRARRCIDPAATCAASRVQAARRDKAQNNAQDDGRALAELQAALRQRMAEQGWD